VNQEGRIGNYVTCFARCRAWFGVLNLSLHSIGIHKAASLPP